MNFITLTLLALGINMIFRINDKYGKKWLNAIKSRLSQRKQRKEQQIKQIVLDYLKELQNETSQN